MKVYIVSSRYGCELEWPMVFYNLEDAENYIKTNIIDLLIENYDFEMKNDNVNVLNGEDVLQWGLNNEYCACYNNDFPDTYTADDDWSEYKITDHIIEKKK